MYQKLYHLNTTGEARIVADEYSRNIPCDLIPVEISEGYNAFNANHVTEDKILFVSNLSKEARIMVDAILAGIATNEEDSEYLVMYILIKIAIEEKKEVVEIPNRGFFAIIQ